MKTEIRKGFCFCVGKYPKSLAARMQIE